MVWRSLLFAGAVAAIAVPVGFAGGDAYERIDAIWYLLIAQGRTSEAMQPFAARQLGPLIVRGLAALTHVSLYHCFFALGVVSLLTVAVITGWLLLERGAGWLALVATGGLYFWTAIFGGFMLPDTFGAALLAVFLLCLWREQFAWSALLLFPMFVARESTVLVLACLLIVGWRRLSWATKGLAVVSSAAGMLVVKHLTVHALSNRENISPLLYMLGKVPWNFCSNVLGMGPWMTTFTTFCPVPRWTMHLPAGLHIGAARVVGLCGWDITWHPRLILIVLCSFGLLPMLTLYLLRYHSASLWSRKFFVQFCVVFGTVSFLMAPLLGRTIERLYLYSWPLFLLITPVAAAQVFQRKRIPWAVFLPIHLATAWLDGLLFASWEQASVLRAWTLCVVVICLNLLAWRMLRRADTAVRATI
jgi:hypothetical protein